MLQSPSVVLLWFARRHVSEQRARRKRTSTKTRGGTAVGVHWKDTEVLGSGESIPLNIGDVRMADLRDPEGVPHTGNASPAYKPSFSVVLGKANEPRHVSWDSLQVV